MLKIAITGPESSGKTSLTEALSTHFKCSFTKEYAREYLSLQGGYYKEEDLLSILTGQLNLEKIESKKNGNYLFCDTDPLVIWIWSKVKFNKVDKRIDESWHSNHYDLYLLLRPDIDWEYDPLRENKEDREQLFSMYESMLKESNRPYTVIEGDFTKRLKDSINAVNRISS